MNILYHHRTRGKSVEGVHIREIVNSLNRLGNEVLVLSPPGVNPLTEEQQNTDTGSWLSYLWSLISRHMPQIGFELLEFTYNIFAFVNIRRALKRNSIDFIYEKDIESTVFCIFHKLI